MLKTGGNEAVLRLGKYCFIAGLAAIAVAAVGISCGGSSQDASSSPNQAAGDGRLSTAQSGVPPEPGISAGAGRAPASQDLAPAPPQMPQSAGPEPGETERPMATTGDNEVPIPPAELATPGTSTSQDTSGAGVAPEGGRGPTPQNTGLAPTEVPQSPVSEGETGGESEASNAGVPGPGHSALSTRDLKSVPKGDYPWVVMVDTDAFIAGDVPPLVGSVIGIPYIPSLLAEASGVPTEQLQGAVRLLDGYDIPADAVEKATVVGGNFGDNKPLEFAVVLEGDFDYAEILDFLNRSGYWLRAKGPGLWFYESEDNGVASFEDDGYLIIGDPADVGAAFDEMSRSANRSDVTWAGDIGISTGSIRVAASVSDDDRPYSKRVIALQGAFDFARIRSQLSVNGYLVDPENVEGYEVWQRPDDDIVVALVDYNDYVLLGDRYLISDLFHTTVSPLIPGRLLRQVYGTKLAEVDTLVSLGGGTAILGDYDPEEFRTAMQGNEQVEGATSEAWILTDPVTSRNLFAELLGGVIYTFPVGVLAEAAGETELRDDAGNPLVKAMEIAGPGWLLGAWSGPWYCKKFVFDLDVDSCQATALAVQSAGNEAVAANWVILMDGQEAAAQASGQLESALAAKEDLLSVASVLSLGRTEDGLLEYEVTNEGDAVVVKLRVTTEYAAQFLYLVLSEMNKSLR